jgi:Fur family transcriptional regulator, ferric uptake regulator
MKHDDQFEKANFRTLLEADQLNQIQDRLNIIDVFLGTEEHITLEELYLLLKEKGYDYDPEFVRQSLNRMVELGFAHRKKFEDQPVRYEHRHLGKHHDHLICTKCGTIVEFSDRELEMRQVSIAADHGFHMLQHRMEIYGLCSSCQATREPLMPLSMAKPGEVVVIKEVAGGAVARARLGSMGLRQGDSVEIVSNDGQGRLIIGHDCTRLALGRGVALKILVTLTPEKKGEKPKIIDF